MNSDEFCNSNPVVGDASLHKMSLLTETQCDALNQLASIGNELDEIAMGNKKSTIPDEIIAEKMKDVTKAFSENREFEINQLGLFDYHRELGD